MPWFSLWLACSAPPAEAPPAEAPPDVGPAPVAAGAPRVVDGPWRDGAYVAVAAGPDGSVHAIWVDRDVLSYARAPSPDAPFAAPERVTDGVVAGDGGQALPAIEVGPGGPVLAFARHERPHLATRGDAGFVVTPLSTATAGHGMLLDLALVAGEPLVAWLDTRRDPARHVTDVYAWWGGREHVVYADGSDGVCMCCRPAAGVIDGRPTVAFRDADGDRREVRRLSWDGAAWVDHGAVTAGGWSPGGCPADGPILADGHVWVSDARDGRRRVYRDDVAVTDAGDAVQPRVAAGRLLYVSAAPGALRLLADGGELAAATGRLEPGDPIAVGDRVWVPWQGERATVVEVR